MPTLLPHRARSSSQAERAEALAKIPPGERHMAEVAMLGAMSEAERNALLASMPPEQACTSPT